MLNGRAATFVATCTCGWESEPTIKAGLASTLWDAHYIDVAHED